MRLWINISNSFKKTSNRGAVLYEAAFTALVWGVLVAGMHLAVIKFWNARLEKLDRERLVYDGIRP